MGEQDRISEKTTITVTRKTRLALEIVKQRYHAVSVDQGLLSFFEEFTPAFLDRAEEADRILSNSETQRFGSAN